MALIIVSGQPSSGKSTASARLKELLESRCLGVCIIAEPSLRLVRNESYKGGHARGSINIARSSVDTVQSNYACLPATNDAITLIRAFPKYCADSVSEKITRGRLKSAAERHINRNTIVILDSLNNIKGYR
jgi:protein KTI12